MFNFWKNESELDLCFREIKKIQEGLSSNRDTFLKLIFPGLKDKLKKNAEEISRLWNYGKFSRELYLKNEISRFAFRLIDNGDCYIDTGILNKEGRELEEIFLQMITDLKAGGFINSATEVEAKSELKKAISQSTSPENKDKAVAACFSELKSVEKELENRGWLFIGLIKNSIHEQIRDRDKTFWSTLEGNSPKTTVLITMSNSLTNALTSGEYHIGRGILSMTGQELRRGYTYVNSELTRAGYQTKESALKDWRALESEIKNMG